MAWGPLSATLKSRPYRCGIAGTDAGLLALRIAGAELPADVLEYVVGAADGLPLLVEELVAGLIESGAVTLVARGG